MSSLQFQLPNRPGFCFCMSVTKIDYWGFMARISISSLNIFLPLSFSCMMWTCSGAENIGNSLKPGDILNSTSSLVSSSGKFTLEFWTNGTISSYLVTLHGNGPNQAWVANRDMPIPYPTGVLTLDMNNTLKITTQKGGDPPIVLHSAPKSISVVAILLDSGNFVLQEVNSKKVLWESFDYPADTFLPGMKLGVNHKTGKIWSITSWKTHTNPEMGIFNLDWDPNGHQLELRRRGVVYWRSGKFTSNRFEFILPYERRYNFSMVSNEYEDYLTYAALEDQTNEPEWILRFQGRLYDNDDQVGIVEADVCDGNNTDGGCQRRDRTPDCTTGFGFSNNFEQKNGSFKPSTSSLSSSRCPYWLNFASDKNYSSSSTDCQATCWQDCDCIGYDFLFDNQTGCRFWSVDCHFSEDLTGSATTTGFVVMTRPPMIRTSSSRKKAHDSILIGTAIAAALVVMVLCIFCCLLRRRKMKLSGKNRTKIYQKELLSFMRSNRPTDVDGLQIDGKMGQDLSVFSYASVLAATCNFSEENKLGQGGFGPVYKGKLVTGEEIAVKKLSKSSGQGVSEFKNELILIYELQHTNLVRLFGFCLHGEERMLIYEYMTNKSLDYFLFDSTRGMFLDWKKRFNIIEGLAQGLIYLHKYSRLRVIHRDLKASNVLLDENMNPKISDFGMAKIFTHNEMEANTSRIVGTRGYMPPEYANEGILSIKTDVYSFGVLLLEIISGKKSNSFYNDDHVLNIVGYAWRLWKEGTWLELMDPTLGDSCNRDQFLRCVHVGLLCVEENGEDRPTMLEVIQALTNETMALPAPTKPAFCIERTAVMTSGMGGGTGQEIESLNGLSISEFTGR